MATASSIIGNTSATLPASTGNGGLDAYTQAALNSLSSGVNYAASPTYQSLSALLGPGQNGGLNPSLLAQYNAALPLINQQTGANTATAISAAQGNGLGGSSIQAQGAENAQFQGTMAATDLLSSLYGEQNQNTQALASDLFAGSTTTQQQLQDIFGNAGSSSAEISMYQAALQEALQQASQANNTALEGAGIGAVGNIGAGLLGAYA